MKKPEMEIKNLQEKHDSFNIHQKVKEITGRQRLTELGWKYNFKLRRKRDNYVKLLFEDIRTNQPPVNDDTGQYILMKEITNRHKRNEKQQSTVAR